MMGEFLVREESMDLLSSYLPDSLLSSIQGLGDYCDSRDDLDYMQSLFSLSSSCTLSSSPQTFEGNSMTDGISPMLLALKDPFSADSDNLRPAPLQLDFSSSYSFSSSSSSSYLSASPPPFNSLNTPLPSLRQEDSVLYPSLAVDRMSLSAYATKDVNAASGISRDFAAEGNAKILEEMVQSPDVALRSVPFEFQALEFALSTYRWFNIEDCYNGVPVVEIRPYNRSDGKRYMYLRCDGLEETSKRCRAAGIPMPKIRLLVEKCVNSEFLGFLTTKPEVPEGSFVASIGSTQKIRSLGSSEDSDSESNVRNGASEVDNEEKEIMDLSKNLTLQVPECIVRKLDDQVIGRGGPQEEHKLRIVVILISDGKVDESCSMEEQLASAIEMQSLPFFRIKRRPKKRSRGQKINLENEELPDSPDSLRGKTRRKSLEEKVNSSRPFDVSGPQALPVIPFINTAPNSKHFVDIYCSNCGQDQSVKLVDSSSIVHIKATVNEIWVSRVTGNLKPTSPEGSQASLSCRFCRTTIGEFLPSSDVIAKFRLRYVHPVSMKPLIYLKISSTLDITSLRHFFSQLNPVHSHQARSDEEILSWGREHIVRGFIGRPLLESEFPDHDGCYTSLACVNAIHRPPVISPDVTSESRILELIADAESTSSTAWSVKAMVASTNRSEMLRKLRDVASSPEILRLVHLLGQVESGIPRISPKERARVQEQFFQAICAAIFENPTLLF